MKKKYYLHVMLLLDVSIGKIGKDKIEFRLKKTQKKFVENCVTLKVQSSLP